MIAPSRLKNLAKDLPSSVDVLKKPFRVDHGVDRFADRPVQKSVALPRTVCSFLCDFIALKIMELDLE